MVETSTQKNLDREVNADIRFVIDGKIGRGRLQTHDILPETLKFVARGPILAANNTLVGGGGTVIIDPLKAAEKVFVLVNRNKVFVSAIQKKDGRDVIIAEFSGATDANEHWTGIGPKEE